MVLLLLFFCLVIILYAIRCLVFSSDVVLCRCIGLHTLQSSARCIQDYGTGDESRDK